MGIDFETPENESMPQCGGIDASHRIDERARQERKASSPISVIVPGNVISESSIQLENRP